MRTGLLVLIGAWATLAAAQVARADDVQALADRIDELVAARWAADDVTPAPRADDAEYLRRVWLDVAGRIPPVAEVRAFLADSSPDKRRRVVDRLLDGPGYITHFATIWRAVMIPEATASPETRFLAPGFEAWLRQELTNNAGYGAMVRTLLTVPLNNGQPPAEADSLSPVAFYLAKQAKPENLAAATARVFLGVRIECAQCHNHPFDHWKREEFWSYAAFFAGVQPIDMMAPAAAPRESANRHALPIPDTDMVVQAAFLGGEPLEWEQDALPRARLAEWITSPENPYFARAAVNRLWAQLFGVGLVDPVDDFSETNPPSHPELLDDLATAFAAHDFDLKFLIRAITASRTYQLSSRQTHPSQERPQAFARHRVRGLTAEQIYASIAQAAGAYQPSGVRNVPMANDGSVRGEFLDLFANESESPTQQQTTVLQSLAMMNGDLIAAAADPQRSATLGAVLDYPLMTDAQRIETLYLAALTRRPGEAELHRLLAYIERGGTSGDRRAAFGDLFWALLNSSEFLFNH